MSKDKSNSENQLSFKDNSERKYFCMIPHAITEIGLTGNEIALYLAIKKSAGECSNCTKSISKLSKSAGVCPRSIFNIIQKLSLVNKFLNKPLIICHSRITESGDKDTNLIEVVDIWKESNELIEKIYGHATIAVRHATIAVGVMQPLHEGHATIADKEEYIKKKPIKKKPPPLPASISESEVESIGGGGLKIYFEGEKMEGTGLEMKGFEGSIRVSESEIYSYFINKKYTTDIIKQAIKEARKATTPVRNITGYLESICKRLQEEKKAPVKKKKILSYEKEEPIKEKGISFEDIKNE